MKVLVLGSEGEVGKPLVEHLRNQGHLVRGWDKKNGPDQDLSRETNSASLDLDCCWADKVVFLAFVLGIDNTFYKIQENVTLMSNVFESLLISDADFLFASSKMAELKHSNYDILKDLGERYTKSLGGTIYRFDNAFGVEAWCKEIEDWINDTWKDVHPDWK